MNMNMNIPYSGICVAQNKVTRKTHGEDEVKKNFSHAVRPRAKINNFIKVPFGGVFSVCFSLFFFMREMMQRAKERQGGRVGGSGKGEGGRVGDSTEAAATHWAYTRHGVGGNA